MPPLTRIEAHVAVTQVGEDEFINTNSPWTPPPGTKAIFGGFFLGQSVSAANQTVDTSNLSVYSMQSCFLRPGSHNEKITYKVDRLVDGRTFATRHVRALQSGKCVYTATVAYQKRLHQGGDREGVSLLYGPRMPDMKGFSPDDTALRKNHGSMIRYLAGSQDLVDSLEPDPFEWQLVNWKGDESNREDATGFRFKAFVRAPALSEDDESIHSAALAFLTDEWFISVPRLALPGTTNEKQGQFAYHASMNHSVHFHEPNVKISDWLVCERKTSWAGNGRVLVENRLWDAKTRRLVLSCSQEGVFLLVRRGPKL